MLFTSDELEKIILDLNSLLMEGHLLKMSINAGYQTENRQEGFNVDEWINQQNKKVNEWYRKTAGIIDSIFHSNSHYLFHFLNHKRAAMSIVG